MPSLTKIYNELGANRVEGIKDAFDVDTALSARARQVKQETGLPIGFGAVMGDPGNMAFSIKVPDNVATTDLGDRLIAIREKCGISKEDMPIKERWGVISIEGGALYGDKFNDFMEKLKQAAPEIQEMNSEFGLDKRRPATPANLGVGRY